MELELTGVTSEHTWIYAITLQSVFCGTGGPQSY